MSWGRPITRLMNGTPPPLVQLSGRIEHDDVAAGVRRPAGRELVDEDVLLRQQGGLHRGLLDLVRLGDEGLDPEEDDDGQHERLDDLEEAAEGRALAHRWEVWLTGAGVYERGPC